MEKKSLNIMKQFTINVPNNKVPFFMELMKTLTFVKIGEKQEKEKYKETAKQEILDGIKDALEEVKLHEEGKIKLKSARYLLDEL
ncbi:hypothetical protein JYT36_00050 [Bacteroidales bacterium AH-315-N07]|nr:hypothetical protein [Bacteroidales bacterium AH-315-N07]